MVPFKRYMYVSHSMSSQGELHLKNLFHFNIVPSINELLSKWTSLFLPSQQFGLDIVVLSVIKLCYQASLPIVKTVNLMYLLSIWLWYTRSYQHCLKDPEQRFNSDSPPFVCLCLDLVNMISLKQSYNYTTSNYSASQEEAKTCKQKLRYNKKNNNKNRHFFYKSP